MGVNTLRLEAMEGGGEHPESGSYGRWGVNTLRVGAMEGGGEHPETGSYGRWG